MKILLLSIGINSTFRRWKLKSKIFYFSFMIFLEVMFYFLLFHCVKNPNSLFINLLLMGFVQFPVILMLSVIIKLNFYWKKLC